MAYRFKLQEPLAQEVRRVALEQIDGLCDVCKRRTVSERLASPGR
jgi:hypothetical protein